MSERVLSLVGFLVVSALMSIAISTCPSGPSPVLSPDRGAVFYPGNSCKIYVGTPEQVQARINFCLIQFQSGP